MTVMTRTFRLGSAALPVVAALLVGCSSGNRQFVVSESVPPTTGATPPTSIPPGTRPDPTTTVPTTAPSSDDPAATAACTLVTEADATAAFGEPARPGTQGSTECWWNTEGDLKTINVFIRHDDLDTWRSGYQNSSWTPIELGDEGYAGNALDSVTFRVGATIYEVNVVYSTSGDPERVVWDLARTVASRV